VIARGLGFGNKEMMNESEELCSEVGRMLCAVLKTLRSKSLVSSS
jgi:hypothetical protein